MRLRARIPVLLLAPLLALLLGACSGGDEVPALELQIVKVVRETVATKAAGKPARPTITRAVLDGLDGALLEATLERRDQLAFLYVNGQRRDDDPGLITTWRTGDDVTLSMRNGVLIATRGLGGDILSSAVLVAGDRPGPARGRAQGGERILTIRAFDNKTVHLVLACEVADLGPATIEIIGLRHATRHLRETCRGGTGRDGTGGDGTVVNDYWVDAQAGVVRQSRQWAGPEAGYLRLRRLTR